MAVPFRFDTVLRVREIERDRCRVALTQAQAREAELVARQSQITLERVAIQDELRAMDDAGAWPADRALNRRQHADHLSAELSRIADDLKEAAVNVARCRSELLEADTGVKGLEKLAGRHDSEQKQAEQKAAERDRDDSWRAA